MLLQKIDSDGLLVVLCEDALAVALDHAGFAHGAVADDNNLEKKRMSCFEAWVHWDFCS